MVCVGAGVGEDAGEESGGGVLSRVCGVRRGRGEGGVCVLGLHWVERQGRGGLERDMDGEGWRSGEVSVPRTEQVRLGTEGWVAGVHVESETVSSLDQRWPPETRGRAGRAGWGARQRRRCG